MKITPTQMRDLRRPALRPFIDETVAYLHQSAPDYVARLSQADLESRIEEGVYRAERYGIRAEIHLRQFILLQTLAGPRFDEKDRFRPVVDELCREGVPAILRLERAIERAHDLL